MQNYSEKEWTDKGLRVLIVPPDTYKGTIMTEQGEKIYKEMVKNHAVKASELLEKKLGKSIPEIEFIMEQIRLMHPA